MGNGQNRNRRGGARTRHGPHRGGGGAGDRRGATHLVPPAAFASVSGAEDDFSEPAELEAAEEAEIEEESFERQAGELRGAPLAETPATELGIEVAAASEQQAEPVSALEPAREAEAPTESSPSPEPSHHPQPQAEQPPAGPERKPARSRFAGLYAPGQNPRVEHNGHAPAASNGARRGPRELTPSNDAQRVDDDDSAIPSGPREDVRGSVGTLIDALHDLFTQDRAVASQGGASRCGICYLHFPLGELIYRDAEGFYVCPTCERSLGSAHVPMVRRQQRM